MVQVLVEVMEQAMDMEVDTVEDMVMAAADMVAMDTVIITMAGKLNANQISCRSFYKWQLILITKYYSLFIKTVKPFWYDYYN